MALGPYLEILVLLIVVTIICGRLHSYSHVNYDQLDLQVGLTNRESAVHELRIYVNSACGL